MKTAVHMTCDVFCVGSGQLFYEGPIVARRGAAYRDCDFWKQSGGIKGSVVFPREGPPRVRRQYGTIRAAGVVKARYFAYTVVKSAEECGGVRRGR